MDLCPDQIEPLIGYRSWRIGLDLTHQPALFSMYQGTEWKPPALSAQCYKRRTWAVPFVRYIGHMEEAPLKACQCGIYAHNSFKGVEWPDMVASRTASTACFVRGQVAGWGHFIQGETGWRAQFAKPLALLAQVLRPLDEEKATALLWVVAEAWSIPVIERFEA